MAGNSIETGRSVTSKVTSILTTFTEGSEHSLTEIARRTGLPISTAHRLTAELASWRLLERTDDGNYRVGLQLRIIGGETDGHRSNLQERAPGVLEDLSSSTRRRARLGVLREFDVAYIEKHPDHRPVTQFSPAATLPAHATGLGRALLAFAPAGMVERTISRGLRAYTDHTVTSADRFRRMLSITRLTHVAVTRAELEQTMCTVAMPVFGPGGDAVAAIELALHDLSTELRSVLPALSVASRGLSRELGVVATTRYTQADLGEHHPRHPRPRPPAGGSRRRRGLGSRDVAHCASRDE